MELSESLIAAGFPGDNSMPITRRRWIFGIGVFGVFVLPKNYTMEGTIAITISTQLSLRYCWPLGGATWPPTARPPALAAGPFADSLMTPVQRPLYPPPPAACIRDRIFGCSRFPKNWVAY